MKFLSKKLIILMLALSMTGLTSMQANAQAGAGAGTIAGVSTATLAIVGSVIIGALLVADAIDDDDPAPFVSTASTTTTTTQGSGSTTTTTTN